MKIDEELLIGLVRERRELYDMQHKQYEDNHRRDEAWQEIGDIMSRPAHECRERWKQLRDNYRKARKLRQAKKTRGITKMKAIKYDKLLAFIIPIIENNLSEPSDLHDNESAGSSMVHVEEPILPGQMDPLTENYMDQVKSDTILTFFTNLGETVKTFPEDVQIRVKREIFMIISEAEEDVCRKRLKIKEVRSVNMKLELNG